MVTRVGTWSYPYSHEIVLLFLSLRPAYITTLTPSNTGAYVPLVGRYAPVMRPVCVSRANEHAASSCLCWWAHASRP
jgi:hypothetical protein